MPEGGRLEILSQRVGDRVRLLFIDTGAGMTEETKERIFECTYSMDDPQVTGIGLYVSRAIIEGHGGDVC